MKDKNDLIIQPAIQQASNHEIYALILDHFGCNMFIKTTPQAIWFQKNAT